MLDLGPVELLTERLHLRAPVESDAPVLLQIHASGEVMRYSNGLPWASIEQSQGFIRSSRSWLQTGRHLCLCVVERSSRQAVGTTTLYDIDRESRRAEIGFVLSELVWRRGYMSEALAAVINYAFNSLNLNRIEADTDPRNTAAIALLESLGFLREGLFRQRWIVGGHMSDSAMYGLLQEDWPMLQRSEPRSVA